MLPAVAGEEGDVGAIDLGEKKWCRRVTVGSLDLHLTWVVEEIVEPGATKHADHRLLPLQFSIAPDAPSPMVSAEWCGLADIPRARRVPHLAA